MQICKYASKEYANMQICKYANKKILANKIFAHLHIF
jgi:hypothetical protein